MAWLPLAQSSFKDRAANLWASSSLMSGSGKLIINVLVLENISNIPATSVKGFCFQTTFFVKANIPLLALTDTFHWIPTLRHSTLVPHYHTSTSHNPWRAKCYCTSVVVPIRSWTLCYCVFWPGSTTFKALLSWTSVKAGAHTHGIATISMHSIDSYQCSQTSLHHSIGKPTWPLLQCVGCEVVKYQH